MDASTDRYFDHRELDWKNAIHSLSLEVGVGYTGTNFGAPDRYRGIHALGDHPVFLGVSLQPAPYVTVGLGAAFVETRSTTLDVQEFHTEARFYGSINIEHNVFDGIVAIATPKGRTLGGSKQ